MTDQVVETNEKQDASAKNGAKINYVLYLASIILGITGLIAVIMAYVNKKDAPEWVQTHYQFQIRTFWIGLLYAVIGGILTVVGIGLLILLFYLVWLIVRCVKGLKALDKNEPIENPTSWMF
ncbi:DUF4870 family protein [Pseudoalteromonas sp. SSM20]|uniref:DUF4870 family protein n=1 Tax=unclassified Pseudoalteromonas TaxID=194690 RepID=UPI00237DF97C|nr:DUF4870 domain-containing protein [Pseudoalteromonas sp. G4]MDE3274142.1 DUF4870 domain-containing protein [Pseudoalteromonas sp. G4]